MLAKEIYSNVQEASVLSTNGNKEKMDGSKRTPSARQRPQASTGLYVKAASGMRVRHRKVRRLVEKMRAVMPWLETSDLPACRAWAELEILGANAFSELLTGGLLNTEGEPRRLLTDYRQLRQVQLSYERELGMTPAARNSIKASGTKAAIDLVAAMTNSDDDDAGFVDEVDNEHRTK